MTASAPIKPFFIPTGVQHVVLFTTITYGTYNYQAVVFQTHQMYSPLDGEAEMLTSLHRDRALR